MQLRGRRPWLLVAGLRLESDRRPVNVRTGQLRQFLTILKALLGLLIWLEACFYGCPLSAAMLLAGSQDQKRVPCEVVRETEQVILSRATLSVFW